MQEKRQVEVGAIATLSRYGLLYHHGGIYMDTDFLVVKDCKPMPSILLLFGNVEMIGPG